MADKKNIKPVSKPDKRRLAFFVGAILIAGLVLYAPFLKGAFLWDDEHLILTNSFLRGWGHLPAIFSSDIGAGAGRSYNFWRPLQMATYLFDYSVWKLDPFGYHFANMALHISGALVLFWLLRLIVADSGLAGVAALLFVVHPVHTEAVSYISGRSDSLAFLFMMLTFVFYLKDAGAKGVRFLWVMAASFSLALLSREGAIVLPVLVALYHGVFRKPFNRRGLYVLAGLVVLVVVLRLTALRLIWPQEPLSRVGFSERWPGAFAALAGYMKILVWPFGLHMEYGNVLFKATDIRVLAGILVFGSWFFLGLRRNMPSIARFGAWWFLCALAPVLNIFVPLDAYMAEHWLYVPCVGFFLIVATGIVSLGRRRVVLAATLTTGLVFFFGALTYAQNRFWMDPNVLFKRIVELSPESTRARVSLALAYKDAGKFVESRDLLHEVLKQKPDDYVAYNVLGSVYYQLGDKDRAAETWRNGMAIEGRFCEFYSNLGVLEAEKGNLKEAVALFREAIRRNSRYADAYKNLAIANYNEGRYDEALESWDRARQLGMREDRVVADAFEQLRAKLQREK